MFTSLDECSRVKRPKTFTSCAQGHKSAQTSRRSVTVEGGGEGGCDGVREEQKGERGCGGVEEGECEGEREGGYSQIEM